MRLDTVPLGTDTQSWVFSSEGTTLHNGEVIGRIKEKLAEGDTLVGGACLCVCVCAVCVHEGVFASADLAFHVLLT